MIGKVPAGPRAACGRAAGGPRTGRACRRCRRWPWPGPGGCSPARRGRPAGRRRCPAMSGAARQDLGLPDRARGVDDGGEERPGMRRAAEHLGGSSPSRRRWISAGDPGVGGVGHVERAPADEGPGHPGVDGAEAELAALGADRSGSAWSRMAATLVAEALGATRMPSAWSSRQVPTVRRSCQPMPGRDRDPGGPVPHDGRGPLVGDADGLDRPALGQAGRGHLEHGGGHGRRRRTPPARERRVGQHRDVVDVVDRRRRGGPPRPAPRRCPRRRPGRCSWPGHRSEGAGRPSLPGLRIPWGSRASLSEASTSKPDPRAAGRKRARLSPMPWWWLMAPPASMVASVTVSQAWR